MSVRKIPFAKDEIYHCFNRGVDKRTVFEDGDDFSYFIDALRFFNDADLDARIRERKQHERNTIVNKHVDILAYCLNPNHFHLLLLARSEISISKFMQKLGTGYTMYFNKKYNRSGSLFQGKFKSVHVDSDEQLKHLGVYVSMNNVVHKIFDQEKYRNSLSCMVSGKADGVCDPGKLLQITDFGDSYESFARKRLGYILEIRDLEKDLRSSTYID